MKTRLVQLQEQKAEIENEIKRENALTKDGQRVVIGKTYFYANQGNNISGLEEIVVPDRTIFENSYLELPSGKQYFYNNLFSGREAWRLAQIKDLNMCVKNAKDNVAAWEARLEELEALK